MILLQLKNVNQLRTNKIYDVYHNFKIILSMIYYPISIYDSRKHDIDFSRGDVEFGRVLSNTWSR